MSKSTLVNTTIVNITMLAVAWLWLAACAGGSSQPQPTAAATPPPAVTETVPAPAADEQTDAGEEAAPSVTPEPRLSEDDTVLAGSLLWVVGKAHDVSGAAVSGDQDEGSDGRRLLVRFGLSNLSSAPLPFQPFTLVDAAGNQVGAALFETPESASPDTSSSETPSSETETAATGMPSDACAAGTVASNQPLVCDQLFTVRQTTGELYAMITDDEVDPPQEVLVPLQVVAAPPTPEAEPDATPVPTPEEVDTTAVALVLANSNLRAGPGTNHPIVGGAQAGTRIEVTARNDAGDWVQLTDGNWIAGFLVDIVEGSLEGNSEESGESGDEGAPAAEPGPVASANSNLRAGPSTDYAIVGTVPAGAPLQVVARNEAGDWIQLAGGNWIAGFLVSNAPAPLPIAGTQ